MRFGKDTFHGEGFAVFFEAPYVPTSTMTTHSVRMERGLQARLASVCQILSGSSSVVSLLHAHQNAANFLCQLKVFPDAVA